MIERLVHTDSFCFSKTSGNLTKKQLCAIITTVALMVIACITIGSLARAGYFSVGGAPGEIGFFSTAGVLSIAVLIFTIYKCTRSNSSQPTTPPEEIDSEALEALTTAQQAEEEARIAWMDAQKAEEEALKDLDKAQTAQQEASKALRDTQTEKERILQQIAEAERNEAKSLSQVAALGDRKHNQYINDLMIPYYTEKLIYAKKTMSTVKAVMHAVDAMNKANQLALLQTTNHNSTLDDDARHAAIQNATNALSIAFLSKLQAEAAVEGLHDILTTRPPALEPELEKVIQRTIEFANQMQQANPKEAKDIEDNIEVYIKKIEDYRSEHQKGAKAAFSQYLTEMQSVASAERANLIRDSLLEMVTEHDAAIQDQELICQQFFANTVEQEAAVKAATLLTIEKQNELRLATNYRMEKERAVKKHPKT